MAVFDLISVVAILAAVIAAPFMIVTWIRNAMRPKEERVFPVKSTLFFAAPVLLGLLCAALSTSIGQRRLAEFLEAVSPSAAISIDGRQVQNPAAVIDILRHIGDLPAHHSSPTRIMNVTVSDPPRRLSLWLARDSSDPHEYWVFFPSPSKLAFRASLKTDIGHLRTTLLDDC